MDFSCVSVAIYCNGEKVNFELRDLDDPKMAFDKEPEAEIHSITGNKVPIEARSHVLQRRASVLPCQCLHCQ